MNIKVNLLLLITILAVSCMSKKSAEEIGETTDTEELLDTLASLPVMSLQPVVTTEPTKYDTDDPCIWINKDDLSKSLIIGTDKDEDGGLYVYDLEGKIIQDKVVRNLHRPNNVDLEYGFNYKGKQVDIAVTTERLTHRLLIYSVPEMNLIGSIDAFEGEKDTTNSEYRDLMGIGLYKDPTKKDIYAIVGRKIGPTDSTYLWQYKLMVKQDSVRGELVRKFGAFSGLKEIESIAVDDKLGYVYYSDEGLGVRKYFAHPDSSNRELALFATEGFQDDHEGISIYELDDKRGYILVSDQQSNEFHIFPREGTAEDPNKHPLLKVIPVSTVESDGSDVTSVTLNDKFKGGLFVAMSEGKVFQYYSWKDIAGDDLEVKE